MPISGKLPRKVSFFPIFRPHDQVQRLKGGVQRPHPIVRRIDHSAPTEPYEYRIKKDSRIKRAGIQAADRYQPVFDPRYHTKLPEKREIRLLRDGRTIFCWHPESNIPFELSRPLVDENLEWKDYRDSVTEEEAVVMKTLREKDPHKFTEAALVRIFEVQPFVVQQLAPPSAQYTEEVRRRLDGIDLLPEKEKVLQKKILEKETNELEEIAQREGVALLKEKGLK